MIQQGFSGGEEETQPTTAQGHLVGSGKMAEDKYSSVGSMWSDHLSHNPGLTAATGCDHCGRSDCYGECQTQIPGQQKMSLREEGKLGTEFGRKQRSRDAASAELSRTFNN